MLKKAGSIVVSLLSTILNEELVKRLILQLNVEWQSLGVEMAQSASFVD